MPQRSSRCTAERIPPRLASATARSGAADRSAASRRERRGRRGDAAFAPAKGRATCWEAAAASSDRTTRSRAARSTPVRAGTDNSFGCLVRTRERRVRSKRSVQSFRLSSIPSRDTPSTSNVPALPSSVASFSFACSSFSTSDMPFSRVVIALMLSFWRR